MWLYLQGPHGPPLGTGELHTDSFRWKAEGLPRKRPALQPGVIYKLFVFGQGVETQEAWTPQQQDGVLMLDLETEPDPQQDPPPPEGHRLLLRIRFRVANDGLLPKVLRWGFESRKAVGVSRFLHLPIHVKVSGKKLLIVVASLAGAQMFSHFHGKVMQGFAHTQTLSMSELLWALPVTLVFGGIAFVVLYVLLEFVWSARD